MHFLREPLLTLLLEHLKQPAVLFSILNFSKGILGILQTLRLARYMGFSIWDFMFCSKAGFLAEYKCMYWYSSAHLCKICPQSTNGLSSL
jgi:hypothetical protein